MKKVALIVGDLEFCFSGGAISGGGGVVVKNLVEALAKMPDIRLTVISQPCCDVGIENVEVIYTGCGYLSPMFVEEAGRIIEERDFDVVLSALWYFCGRNSIIQGHSYEYRVHNAPFLVRFFKKLFSKRKIQAQKKSFQSASKGTKFVVVSEVMKSDYAGNLGLRAEDIIVAYPGVSPVMNEYMPINQNSEINFGIVAGKSMNKGVVLLLAALLFVKLAGYKFKISLLTKNKILKFICKFFTLDNQAKFIESSDTSVLYSDIDCLVLPSLNEAFGLVVLESMAFGKPCIVSSTAGAAEIITKENGFVFERTSFFDLVKKLVLVIDLYKKEFGKYLEISQSAFDTSQKYTWEGFANKIVAGLTKDRNVIF